MRARAEETSPTRTAALTIALLALAHPVFAVLLVVGPLAVAVFHAWQFLVPPMAWTVFAMAGSVLDRSPLPGVAVRPAEEPQLARLVQEIAEGLHIRRALAVRVIPTVDAGVYDEKLRGQPASVIVLGWPLVKHLSADELRAVVAHELAHRDHLDDRRAMRLLSARSQVADSPPGRFWPPRRWRTALLRATQQVSYDHELASDAAAASVVGPAAAASALLATERLDAGYELLAASWVDALAEREQWPEDLYLAMSEAMRDPLVQHRIDRMIAQLPPHDVDESHPSTAERVAAFGELPPLEPSAPLELRASEELERHVTELLAEPNDSPVRVLELEPDALTDDRRNQDLLDQLVKLTGAHDRRGALGEVHRRVRDGKWQPLAQDLEPALRGAPVQAERLVMAGALSHLLVSQLRLAGWQRKSRWVRSSLVGPDGTTVHVRDVIDAALETGDCTELDTLVAKAQP